jgi:hypothetical protein
MVSQLSPEMLFKSMVVNRQPTTTNQSLVQQTPQNYILEAVETTPQPYQIDPLIVLGVVSVVGLVALCYIAYQREKKDERNSIQPTVHN